MMMMMVIVKWLIIYSYKVITDDFHTLLNQFLTIVRVILGTLSVHHGVGDHVVMALNGARLGLHVLISTHEGVGRIVHLVG